MQLDVIIDVVCPWCYIGKRRVDALREAAPNIDFKVIYRPFFLAPNMPKEGKDRRQHFAEKFGPDADLKKMSEGLLSQAGDIDFQFDRIERVPNTMDAHRLIAWSANENAQEAVVEAVFQAYFTDGRDIGDAHVLTDIAAQAGLQTDVVKDLLASEQDVARISAAAMQATGMGIQGVPFYIFAGAVGLSGAQPVEVLLQAAEKAGQAAA
ncbi:MAG: DsbA family oxidoreductase [Sphingomonadales bacterium]